MGVIAELLVMILVLITDFFVAVEVGTDIGVA